MTRIIRAQRDPARPSRKLPRPGTTRVLRAAQIEGLRESERALATANETARAILARASEDADSLLHRAEEEGRARAAALLLDAERQVRARLDQVPEELTRLGVRIAEKLLGEALRLDPSTVTRIVGECLRRSAGAKRIVLRVHPSDLALVESAMPRLRALAESECLALEPDPSLEAGGCLVETEVGQVDGRISAQLREIEKALAP
jgi:flagellar assembly protein FliH